MRQIEKPEVTETTIYFAIFIIIKLVLIFSIPLLDDEAYFITWGKSFELGYYDHPPMVGWVIWAFSFISDSHLFLRFIPFTLSLIISALIYKLLKQSEREFSLEISLIFFMSLLSILNTPILNDTILLFFGSFSLYFFLKDQITPAKVNIPLSCLFLSLSFMAKYFAAILGLVYLVTLIFKKRNTVIRYLLWTTVFVVPSLIIQYYWNSQTCWNNIMFNVVNRHTGQGSFELLSFVGTLILFLNPMVFWYSVKSKFTSDRLGNYSKWIWLISLSVFGLISIKTLVGAHWLFIFLIAPYLTLGVLNKKQAKTLLRFSALYSGVVATGLFVVLNKAEKIAYETENNYSYYQHFFHPKKICDLVSQTVPKNYQLMADGYSPASILSSICGYDVPVIFHQGIYGRQSDFRMDFSKLAGKDIAIYTDIHDGSKYKKYFEKSKLTRTPLLRGDVKILLGQNFNYDLYRKDILQTVLKKIYDIPAWLPAGKCHFHDKYFPNYMSK